MSFSEMIEDASEVAQGAKQAMQQQEICFSTLGLDILHSAIFSYGVVHVTSGYECYPAKVAVNQLIRRVEFSAFVTGLKTPKTSGYSARVVVTEQ